MALKISNLTPVIEANLTDLFETTQGNEEDGYTTGNVSNAQLQTLFGVAGFPSETISGPIAVYPMGANDINYKYIFCDSTGNMAIELPSDTMLQENDNFDPSKVYRISFIQQANNTLGVYQGASNDVIIINSQTTSLPYGEIVCTRVPNQDSIWIIESQDFLFQGFHEESVMAQALSPNNSPNGASYNPLQTTTNANYAFQWGMATSGSSIISMLVPMPKSWNGGDISLKIYSETAQAPATSANTIVYLVTALVRRAGDAVDLAFGFPASYSQVVSAANVLLITSAITVTPGGTYDGTDCELEIRISRNGGSGDDNLPGIANIRDIKLGYIINKGNDA